MLLIGGAEDPAGRTAAEICASPEVRAWDEGLRERGIWRGGNLLRPPEEAKTVRVRDGAVVLSDGPFAETKDQVGGYTLIECADRDEALAAAAGHPCARFGMVEVRELWSP
jgi:hypothetical protein